MYFVKVIREASEREREVERIVRHKDGREITSEAPGEFMKYNILLGQNYIFDDDKCATHKESGRGKQIR